MSYFIKPGIKNVTHNQSWKEYLLKGGGVPYPCAKPCGGGNPPGGVETMYEVKGGGGGGAPLPGGGGPYPPGASKKCVEKIKGT